MKSTIKKVDVADYPVLKIYKDTGSVVLFSSKGKGICVVAGEGDKLGEYSTAWSEEYFEKFYGKVILEN